jgi:hypothetical protein
LFFAQVLLHSSLLRMVSVRLATSQIPEVQVIPASRLSTESIFFECATLAAESNHVVETAIASRATQRKIHGCGWVFPMAAYGGSELEAVESNGKIVVVEGSPRLNFSTSFASKHYEQLMACIGIDTRSALWVVLDGRMLGSASTNFGNTATLTQEWKWPEGS